MMSNRDADFTTWIERNAAFGGDRSYAAVPKRAWREFEASYAHWEERRKTRLR
jgi:hypothetical protein